MYGVTNAHLAYLHRVDHAPVLPGAGAAVVGPPPERRTAVRLLSVGTPDKHAPDRDPTDRSDPGEPPDPDQPAHQPSGGRTELVAGLHAVWTPLMFAVHGDPDGISVEYGSWSDSAQYAAARLAQRGDVISAVLAAAFPTVSTAPAAADRSDGSLVHGGMCLGVPALGGYAERVAPIDRVIRAMAGRNWSVRILAYPEADDVAAQARQRLANAARQAQSQARAEGGPSPLADEYVRMCQAGVRALTESGAVGAWRTAVYLLGDRDSYPRLAAVWRSAFAAPAARLEPVRVFTVEDAVRWAREWAMPDPAPPDGPDGYRRPYECQTLLSSAQLGIYVQPPRRECAGFGVRSESTFDLEPPPRRDGRERLVLGNVRRHDTTLRTEYTVPVADLTRHTFVTGVTGSGKTNTVTALLHRAAAAGVPYLVLEPAKASYRALLVDRRVATPPRVFTLGDETVSPLRLNPFEVEPGTSVQMHLDLLRSLFVASFGMWEPLPQVLERCLFEIYTDRGWDVGADLNHRLGSDPDPDLRVATFPTLADLVAKAEEVIAELGYEDKITDNIRAALVTRVNALRVGGKGAMLDTQRSTPSADLFDQPAVLELERLGDDDDKAFVMGLTLIRLAGYRRARGYHRELRQLLVIEEAHRLLAGSPPKQSEFGGDPKAKAVTAFTNLLAEVREYGLGVVIADQVPVKLAPEVIKNTGLKIAHRLVAEDDRRAMGGAMAMRPQQIEALTTLKRGVAAMFAEEDDGPVLVEAPPVKDDCPPPPDDVVRARMAGQVTVDGCPAGCPSGSPADEAGCRLAADVTRRDDVRRCADRVLATTVVAPDRMGELWPEVGVLLARELSRRRDVDPVGFVRCAGSRLCRGFAHRRGAASGWSYRDTMALADALVAVLPGDAAAGNATPGNATPGDAAAALARTVERVCGRTVDPFPRCRMICAMQPCRFRYDAGLPVRSGELRGQLAAARTLPAPDRYLELLEIGRDAANLVFAPPRGTPAAHPGWLQADQVALCYLQQALLAEPDLPVGDAVEIVDRVCLEAAGQPVERTQEGEL